MKKNVFFKVMLGISLALVFTGCPTGGGGGDDDGSGSTLTGYSKGVSGSASVSRSITASGLFASLESEGIYNSSSYR
jgi:hypothetical protein